MSYRIALVGAGSRDFGRAMIRDLLLSESLNDGGLEIALMDVNQTAVDRNLAYAVQVAEALVRSPAITAHTDLDSAFAGADAVFVSIEIHRYFYWAQDFHIPRQFGFPQIYGENGGAGGLFHALRNMGPLIEIARTMERLCPDAWLLNFTNPLTKLCEAVTRLTSVRSIGLCHGVFEGQRQVARLLERPVESLETRACGLNHFAWFHDIRDVETGEDLYPLLRANERRAHWLAEWDEIALSRLLLRTFGLYPSPGANHIGEYVRWADAFLGSSKLQFFYDPRDGHPWDSGQEGDAPTWIYNLHDHPTDTALFPTEAVDPHGLEARNSDEVDADALRASGELAVPIVEGLLCGVSRGLDAVNVRNDGSIPGLDDDTVVEVPASVSRAGLTVAAQPRLPEGVLALLRTQASINTLLVQAFEDGSRDTLLQALLIDPVTPSYRAAVDVIDELCRLQADVLPPLRWTGRG